MKLVHPDYQFQLECREDAVVEFIIENPIAYRKILWDIQEQMDGAEGRFVLSDGDKILSIRKELEFIDNPLNLVEAEKKILNSFYTKLKEQMVDENHYEETYKLTAEIQKVVQQLTLDFSFGVSFNPELDLGMIIKATGIQFDSIGEDIVSQIIQHMDIVNVLLEKEVFIFHNLKCFLTDEELELLYKDILYKKYKLLLIENTARTSHNVEKRYIIDEDNCEIY